jgi:hypothetical protein
MASRAGIFPMTEQPTSSKTDDDPKLKEALAVLISSTHNKKRSLSLPEIAHWLGVAVQILGSYGAIADRIGLSAKMLRQFSSVDRLNRPVQKLFASREVDSVDAATHLAILPSEDQLFVAQSLAARKIDTQDVRALVQLRKADQKSTAETLLRRVIRSKTQQHYVFEFIVRGAPDRARLLKSLHRYVPYRHIVAFELNGLAGRLTLDQIGKEHAAQAAKRLNVPFKQVIQRMLSERP